nr:PREDICTED: interleukin-27 receptor subunit alpha [Latimeria chalumnae]|eukprot:XP_014348586.1 PREDICTED: interleukin-27 receptor subunit alpha [Latimeria chalumnae]
MRVACVLSCAQNPSCEKWIEGGYPPDKPKDLYCYRKGKGEDVNCTWQLGRETLISTTYTFHYKNEFSKQQVHIPEGKSHVIIPRENLTEGFEYDTWVKAENGLGEARSESLHFLLENIFKPAAPRLKLSNDPDSDSDSSYVRIDFQREDMLGLTDKTLCEALYRRADNQNWTMVDEEAMGTDCFDLEDLEPFTEYRVQVRCKKHLWSDWSQEFSFWSPEQSPVGKVDVWVVSEALDSELLVLWKRLQLKSARGKILRYSIQYQLKESSNNTTRNVMESDCCRIRIPLLLNYVAVTAHNAAGHTQPAKLSLECQGHLLVSSHRCLPPLRACYVSIVCLCKVLHGTPFSQQLTYLPPPKEVVAVSKNQTLTVSWTPADNPHEPVIEYLVEWKEAGQENLTGLNWTRQNATLFAVLTDDFKPCVCYLISVFSLHATGISRPASTLAYVEQGAPSSGPEISISLGLKNEATVTWQEVPLLQRNGVITHYNIYLTLGSQTTTHTVAALATKGKQSFTLSGLELAKSYEVSVSASTKVGEGKHSDPKHFKIPALGPGIALTMILIFMAIFILAAVILVLVFRDRIQRLSRALLPAWCCQEVPDPYHSKIYNQANSESFVQHGSVPVFQEPLITKVEEVQEEEKPREVDDLSTMVKNSSDEDLLEEYTKDLSEEHNDSADASNQQKGKPIFSDYEKHFLPTSSDLEDSE